MARPRTSNPKLRIALSGAGSSAFVGETVASFARSGKIPESVASVEAADRAPSERINWSSPANSDGRLAKLAADNPNVLFHLLPEQMDDRSFAATGNHTSMLVSPATVLAAESAKMFALVQGAFGVSADSPCPTGEVNRAVQGVAIHPYRP